MMESRSEIEVRMPNLVFELVSKHMCPKYLRPCRLVCKSWNNIACEILKKFPVAFEEVMCRDQEKYNQRLSEFLDLLASRREEVSHPFRKISIKGMYYRGRFWELIMRLRQYEDIEVSKLIFHNWNGAIASTDLERELMTWTQGTLKSLSFELENSFFCNKFEWELVNLEKLEIRRRCFKSYEPREGPIKALLENILLRLNLSKLSLKIDLVEVEKLKEVLSVENIRRVLDLEMTLPFQYVRMEQKSEFLRYFTQNPFPNLKKLEIHGKLEFTLQLVGIFAQSLEILTYNQHCDYNSQRVSLLDLDLFPTFPQLRELHLIETNTCVIGRSFLEKFPSLKRFSCGWGLKTVGEVRPHFGVEYVHVRIISAYKDSEHNSEICSFCKVRQDLLKDFPHFEQYIRQAEECRGQGGLCAEVETLWSMVNNFPNVRALKIWDIVLMTFLSKIGTTLFKDDVTDVRFENVFRCLFPLHNFLELNSLDLTPSHIIFTPAVVRLGLGKIPALKYLRVEDGSLPTTEDPETVKAFWECLEPLNELQLLKVCRFEGRYTDREAFVAKLFPLDVKRVCTYYACKDCDRDLATCKCQRCKNVFPFEPGTDL